MGCEKEANSKLWLEEGFTYGFRESTRLMGKDKKKIPKEVIREVDGNLMHREACRLLGINNSIELAILTIELPLRLPAINLKGLLGYTPSKNKG